MQIEIDGSCRVLAIEESPYPLLAEAAREAVGEFTVAVRFSLE